MPEADRKGTERLFSEYKEIKMDLKCDDPAVNGDTALARCSQTMRLSKSKGGKAGAPVPWSADFSLRRVGGAWRLLASSKAK